MTAKVRLRNSKFKSLLDLKLEPLKTIIRKPSFAKNYALAALMILLATTLVWSILGASLQRSNADQIVNGYLFADSATFHQASFPAAHTQLIKWPIFWLISVLGVSGFSLALFTVLLSLITVGCLAYMIYRVDRRPLVFGTFCLALASVLLLIPALPYVGGLLPVNLAMITTRNLEYVFYITSLMLLIGSPRLKSWRFVAGTSLLAILIASDRLFLTLSLGGALAALVFYIFKKADEGLVAFARKWLLSGLISSVIAIGGLWLISNAGFTHFASQGDVGPFGLVHSFKNLALGLLYSVMGLFTNFGANPAFDASIVRHIPSQLFSRLFGWGFLSYLINALILAAMIIVWVKSFFPKKTNKYRGDQYSTLASALVWSTIAAFVAFIASKHYYAVDARYLTIALFAGFVSLAVYSRTKVLSDYKIVIFGSLITLGLLFSLVGVLHIFNEDKTALANTNLRNHKIAVALSYHPVNMLVGDYWRVVPVKLASNSGLSIMPLAACGQPQGVLSSSAWRLKPKTSFAYLISYDSSLTSYQNCSLAQVINAYGRPNASSLIDGSIKNPKEQLLFYDKGINKKPTIINSPPSQAPSTVVPIPLNKLPNTDCQSQTIMNVIAHQDDDLLFINPDLQHAIDAGYCTRTVYVTAGDAGGDQFYWLSREVGAETAYDYMDGPTKDVWITRIVELANNEFIRVANPRGDSKHSLIFVRLPDGNPKGSGFKNSGFESLAKLDGGKIPAIHTVDGQSTYTSQQLTDALTALMRVYQPTEIRTQANFISRQYPDHSDHMAIGRFTQQAWQQFDPRVPIKYYIGYPIYERPANVGGQDLIRKEAAFFNYSNSDSAVCRSLADCEKSKASYNAYLPRQYIE